MDGATGRAVLKSALQVITMGLTFTGDGGRYLGPSDAGSPPLGYVCLKYFPSPLKCCQAVCRRVYVGPPAIKMCTSAGTTQFFGNKALCNALGKSFETSATRPSPESQ